MIFGIIILAIVGIWLNYKIISRDIEKFKDRHREITYSSDAGIEFIGIIERSYDQMILQHGLATIEIDGQAFTQKTGKREGYNVSSGEHFIKCYEGEKGRNIGVATINVNIPKGYVCKIKYTASMTGIFAGTIKKKIVPM